MALHRRDTAVLKLKDEHVNGFLIAPSKVSQDFEITELEKLSQ